MTALRKGCHSPLGITLFILLLSHWTCPWWNTDLYLQNSEQCLTEFQTYVLIKEPILFRQPWILIKCISFILDSRFLHTGSLRLKQKAKGTLYVCKYSAEGKTPVSAARAPTSLFVRWVFFSLRRAGKKYNLYRK